uniref:Transposase n=1 Tax=Haemonchus contortus TaxID=6289 RepID=A0A7I5EB61_HAECO
MQDEYIAPPVSDSEFRNALTSMKNYTALAPDRIKPEHLRSPPPIIVRTLVRLFTRYLGREVNMVNGIALELCRRKRAAWGAFKNIEGVVKKTKNIRLRANIFDTAVLDVRFGGDLGSTEAR